jgi:hypothetical protein
MADGKQFFCLECDVVLMRLYGEPDLASARGVLSAAELEGNTETYTCPQCGVIVVRQATDEMPATLV